MPDCDYLSLPSTFPAIRVSDNTATSSVILHAPHGGRAIPAEHVADYLVSAAQLEAEKDVMTDHFTDDLVAEAAGATGASAIINRLSRFAVDVERFPDETEEMNAVGMGVLYTHGSQGQEIRRLDAIDQAPLLAYFADYSARFSDLVDRALAAHGRAVIIDVHSYPEFELPYELHGSVRRPLCVGFDPFHASDAVLAAVAESFGGFEWAANEPFAGAYVPLKHYHQDPRVSSIMLEIRRDVYMSEADITLEPAGFAALQSALQALVRGLS